ncbi:MAG: class II aldolase/adducin family protein [Chloroflexi bacterium]|nr:class II aldolase/adducin family protein [Chloroflexota bacterium]MCL5076277.1 class II aldolase/adducin family protein [Chloroflexota bacterium]
MAETSLIEAQKDELARIARRAYERGLVTGTGGNVSVRIPGTAQLLITASGVSLGDMTTDNIITVDLDGNPAEQKGQSRPSMETAFHAAIYRLRPDVGAVIHLHPPHATAYSLRGTELPLVTSSAQGALKLVPCIDYAPAGSTQLRELVIEAVQKYGGLRALLMKKHGILTMGTDLTMAYHLADLVESSAHIAFIASLIPAGMMAVE